MYVNKKNYIAFILENKVQPVQMCDTSKKSRFTKNEIILSLNRKNEFLFVIFTDIGQQRIPIFTKTSINKSVDSIYNF